MHDPQSQPTVPAVRPPRPSFFAKDRTWLNVALFVATILSAFVVGIGWSISYIHAEAISDNPALHLGAEALRDPRVLGLSVLYAVVLLVILLGHELGHYLTCRRYGLSATLPFFVPAPTLIGTLGAFIKIRTPIRNKRQLFDVGAAGPLVGFILAIPALAYGLAMSKAVPPLTGEGTISFGEPLILKLIGALVLPAVPQGYDIVLHPVAFAGWVGVLITALNLFPAGQLDGGHVSYAVFGRRARTVSRIVVALFFAAGVFFWLGWLIWAFLILIMGTKHPPTWDEGDPLPRGRAILAVVVLIIFVLCFIPDPIKGYSGLEMVRSWLH
jgi:membrane-associated protease RseP (regulator of RpoE activity)